MSQVRTVSNNQAVDVKTIPVLAIEKFREVVINSVRNGARIASLFGMPAASGSLKIFAVLGRDVSGELDLVATEVAETYPALTPDCPQAQGFERELAEQWAIVPEGHPWLKPLRFHRAYREGKDAWGRPSEEAILPGVTNFFEVQGLSTHEVAVGPVHAGIIEPGHFRFQCYGEVVFHLEMALGYQHRGVETALIGGPNFRTIHYMETLAGDTTIGHALAYAQLYESLAGIHISPGDSAVRMIALELERLANHVGDLGALANDVGFLPTASYCGRLRGDFLNLTAMICGSRFGRGLIRPGGVGFGVEQELIDELRKRLKESRRDVNNAVNLLWDDPLVVDRFEMTGVVKREDAIALGLVGPAARACGLGLDVRKDFSKEIYQKYSFTAMTQPCGDVLSRAWVRWLEIQASLDFIESLLADLPASIPEKAVTALAPDSLIVSLVEGWRGEICHVALTDSQGKFSRYKVVDPSFHNWMGLAMALRQEQISNFPLCNKSFNLSYCGHDL